MHSSLRLVTASTLSLIVGSTYAGGYKIPENSVKSTALSAAYVANAHGADAAYFNPAAMVFNEDRSYLEGNLTYIYLSEIDYAGSADCACIGGLVPGVSESSEYQHFFIPSFHYSSPAVGNARFGLSVITPVGLTKRWKSPISRSFAEKFSLKTVEINPSAAYKFSDKFSAALGLRALYSEGTVKSTNPAGSVTRSLEGDSWDYGYNLALLFKPTDKVNLALTYRSNIDLTVEGDADLGVAIFSYSGFASVEIPAPAALALAAGWDITPETSFEIVLERTYWNKYEQLDFDYDASINPVINGVFGDPVAKNWSDTNTVRLGLTHELDSKWTIMAGYGYDENPAPEATIGFELPDSDAHLFSFGARYKLSDDMTIGGAILYDYKESRTISNDTLDGEFKNATALLATFGVEMKL